MKVVGPEYYTYTSLCSLTPSRLDACTLGLFGAYGPRGYPYKRRIQTSQNLIGIIRLPSRRLISGHPSVDYPPATVLDLGPHGLYLMAFGVS